MNHFLIPVQNLIHTNLNIQKSSYSREFLTRIILNLKHLNTMSISLRIRLNSRTPIKFTLSSKQHMIVMIILLF